MSTQKNVKVRLMNIVRIVTEAESKKLINDGWELFQYPEEDTLSFDKLKTASEFKKFAAQEDIPLDSFPGNASAAILKEHIQKVLDERAAG